MVAGGKLSTKVCLRYDLTNIVAAVFTIRTYCIYGRQAGPACILIVLFLIEFAVKLVSLATILIPIYQLNDTQFITQKWALPLHDPWGFIGCALEPGRSVLVRSHNSSIVK